MYDTIKAHNEWEICNCLRHMKMHCDPETVFFNEYISRSNFIALILKQSRFRNCSRWRKFESCNSHTNGTMGGRLDGSKLVSLANCEL